MTFCSSTIRTDDAKGVWENMKETFGDKHVKKETIKNGYGEDESVYYLSPPQNQNFHDYKKMKSYFSNIEKPRRTKKSKL